MVFLFKEADQLDKPRLTGDMYMKLVLYSAGRGSTMALPDGKRLFLYLFPDLADRKTLQEKKKRKPRPK